MNVKFLLCGLASCLSLILLAGESASAEEFFPVGDNYECVQFSNGNEYLITDHSSPDYYRFADDAALVKSLSKERAKLRDRAERLRDLAPDLVVRFVKSSTMRTFKKYFSAYLFGTTFISFNDIDTQDDRRQAVKLARERIKDRQAQIARMLTAIRDCKAGRLSPPKGGEYIFPTVKLVSFASTTVNESYAGFMLVTNARKNQFSRVPTGFNGCLKIYWQNGTVGGLYTGMGDEPCFGQPGAFQYATAACNATLGATEVGYPLQKAAGVGTSPELLDQLANLALQDRPQAVFLRLPVTMSRDKSISTCNAFLSQ